MAERHQYKPLRFYVDCFAATWVFWITAAFISKSENDNGLSLLLMLFGVMASAVTAVITVLTSGSKALKADLRWKLVGFYRIRPRSILAAVIGFMTIVAVSILLSLLFGKSLRKAAGVDTERILYHFIFHGLRSRLSLALYGHYGIFPCFGFRVHTITD